MQWRTQPFSAVIMKISHFMAEQYANPTGYKLNRVMVKIV